MNIETPFPVEGTITVEQGVNTYRFPCETEWLTETSHGDKLQAAVDRVGFKFDEGTEVRVRFTDDGHGECNHFEILGEVDDE